MLLFTVTPVFASDFSIPGKQKITRYSIDLGECELNLPSRADGAQFVRGFLMGGADIIPGVSGGTVALILGIYERLVTAISHVDAHLIRLATQRQWRAAAEYLDLRFLLTLGLGILTGIVCLAKLMLLLLLDYRMVTLAAFFGLILASSLIVARRIEPRGFAQFLGCTALATIAAVGAFWLVGLTQLGQHEHPGYFFVCGAIAICAMILPGISGAYILWLLGDYETVAGMIHRAPHFNLSTQELTALAAFAAGCAVGIISFSKVLQWLLAKAHMPTMAVLGGFMIGSLRLMWPFQTDLTPAINELKHKRYEPFMPEAWDSRVTICLGAATAAFILILLLERWGRRSNLATDVGRAQDTA